MPSLTMLPRESAFLAFGSFAVEVVVVEHLTEDEELVVMVNLEVVLAVETTTLPSSVLGDDRCEVDVEEVDGGWCSLSMPLSC